MQFIIDRFESDYAVLETTDKKFIQIPLALLPATACEGDAIQISLVTDARRRKIENLMDNLFED